MNKFKKTFPKAVMVRKIWATDLSNSKEAIIQEKHIHIYGTNVDFSRTKSERRQRKKLLRR